MTNISFLSICTHYSPSYEQWCRFIQAIRLGLSITDHLIVKDYGFVLGLITAGFSEVYVAGNNCKVAFFIYMMQIQVQDVFAINRKHGSTAVAFFHPGIQAQYV